MKRVPPTLQRRLISLNIKVETGRKFVHYLLLVFPAVCLAFFTIHTGRNAFSLIYMPTALLLIFFVVYLSPKVRVRFSGLVIFITALALRLICLKCWTITPLSDYLHGLDFSMKLANAKISEWSSVFSQNDYYYNVWSMHIPHKLYQTAALLIFGKSIYSIQLLNTIFSALSCVLAYLLARHLFNRKAGLIAGFLMAFNPTSLLFSALLTNQHPATAFCLLALLLYLARPFKGSIFISAFSLFVSQLLRPEMYVVLIALVCYEIYIGIMEGFEYKKFVSLLLCCTVFFLLLNFTDISLKNAGWSNKSMLDSNLKYKLAVGQNQDAEGRFSEEDYPLAGDEEAIERLV